MNESLLGWAIAGTGSIARRFAADMRLAKRGRVVAVASATPGRAAAFADAIGPDVAAGDLDTVLRNPRVGAVYIAGRNEDHRSQALRCLAAGKPVLIEKPLATTAADAESIRHAAAEAKLLAMEAMWMRFTPGMRCLASLLADGAVGQVRAIDASLAFHDPHPKASPLLDLGVYPVSLAVQLLGSPESVAARATGDGREVAAVLAYPNALVSLRCGFAATGPNVLSVTGDGGILATDAPFFCPSMLTLRRSRPSPVVGADTAEGPLPPSRLPWLGAAKSLLRPLRSRRIPTLFHGTGLQYQGDHFAECVASGLMDSPVMPLAESIEVLRIVEAAAAGSGGFEDRQRLEG